MRISGQSIPRLAVAAKSEKWDGPVAFRGSTPVERKAHSVIRFQTCLLTTRMRNPSITAGFWRGVNINHNTIYVGCFIDELAADSGGNAAICDDIAHH